MTSEETHLKVGCLEISDTLSVSRFLISRAELNFREIFFKFSQNNSLKLGSGTQGMRNLEHLPIKLSHHYTEIMETQPEDYLYFENNAGVTQFNYFFNFPKKNHEIEKRRKNKQLI